MYSKNNIDRPVAEREYFDRPMEFQKESYTFTPSHKRPIDFLWDTRKPPGLRTLKSSQSPNRDVNRSKNLSQNGDEPNRSKTSQFNRTFTHSLFGKSAL